MITFEENREFRKHLKMFEVVVEEDLSTSLREIYLFILQHCITMEIIILSPGSR